jgi:hypothetical protein
MIATSNTHKQSLVSPPPSLTPSPIPSHSPLGSMASVQSATLASPALTISSVMLPRGCSTVPSSMASPRPELTPCTAWVVWRERERERGR